jgi:hypothetical protein
MTKLFVTDEDLSLDEWNEPPSPEESCPECADGIVIPDKRKSHPGVVCSDRCGWFE